MEEGNAYKIPHNEQKHKMFSLYVSCLRTVHYSTVSLFLRYPIRQNNHKKREEKNELHRTM